MRCAKEPKIRSTKFEIPRKFQTPSRGLPEVYRSAGGVLTLPLLDILLQRINSTQLRAKGDGSGGRVAKFFTIRRKDVDIRLEDAE